MRKRSAKSRARPKTRGPSGLAYEYEVFVSYRRRDPVLSWLNNHFFPKLSHWLPQFWPAEMASPRLAKNDQMEVGSRWPERLVEMHSGSRCMVAIVSPEYFRSAWCVSEWRAMQARESFFGLATKSRTRGLIYPVLFCGDASVLPRDAAARQWFDFTKLNFPDEVFRYHPTYVDFDQAVQDVARELVGMIKSAPDREAWPEIDAPPSLARPPVSLPRL
jgi:hypothetical protein